jgi:hypothetical protein
VSAVRLQIGPHEAEISSRLGLAAGSSFVEGKAVSTEALSPAHRFCRALAVSISGSALLVGVRRAACGVRRAACGVLPVARRPQAVPNASGTVSAGDSERLLPGLLLLSGAAAR